MLMVYPSFVTGAASDSFICGSSLKLGSDGYYVEFPVYDTELQKIIKMSGRDIEEHENVLFGAYFTSEYMRYNSTLPYCLNLYKYIKVFEKVTSLNSRSKDFRTSPYKVVDFYHKNAKNIWLDVHFHTNPSCFVFLPNYLLIKYLQDGITPLIQIPKWENYGLNTYYSTCSLFCEVEDIDGLRSFLSKVLLSGNEIVTRLLENNIFNRLVEGRVVSC